MPASVRQQRHKVVLPVLCWNKHRPDFYAVTDDVSVDGIQFRSATVPFISEALTCSIRGVGLVETKVVQSAANVFTVRLSATRQQSAAIVGSLIEYARHQRPVPVFRAQPRIVPRHKDVQVTLETGMVSEGRLINVSATGVALYLGQQPGIGAEILIGRRAATVIRHFPGGVGATFPVPIAPGAVNEDIIF